MCCDMTVGANALDMMQVMCHFVLLHRNIKTKELKSCTEFASVGMHDMHWITA